MVRRSFTAVIEKNSTFTEHFETEPYETGWATEARWFVRVLQHSGTVQITPQISPDGLFWCDEGHNGVHITAPGLYSFPLRDFGNWLRLKGEFSGTGSTKVLIYLALKE